MQSEQTDKLSGALAKAQSAMTAAAFNRTNPHFRTKYADLASVLDAIRKPLTDNGLSITQTTEIREGHLVLVTTLRHGEQWVSSEYPLPVTAKPQELGSALTYARRYSLSAIACIAADEDDDANTAQERGQRASHAPPKPAPNVITAPKSNGNGASKSAEPPHDPETGEVIDGPKLITVTKLPNGGGIDWITWGKAYIDAHERCDNLTESDAVEELHKPILGEMQKGAPKVFARMTNAVAKARAALATSKDFDNPIAGG